MASRIDYLPSTFINENNFEKDLEERVETILAACKAQDGQAELMTLFERLEYQSIVWKVACNRLGIVCENRLLNDQVAEAEYYFEKVLGHVLESSIPPEQRDLFHIWNALAGLSTQKLPDVINSANFQQWLEQNQALLSRTLYLDFRNKGLTSLPAQLFPYLTNLKVLNLNGNKLITLPDSIGQLTQLERLCCEDNQLLILPNSIGRLVNLQELFLKNNQLSDLPEEFFGLTKLDYLNLGDNPIPEGLVLKIGQRLDLKHFLFKSH